MSSVTFDVPLINKLELYFIDTSRFNVIMRDCLRDNGVYFGDYYWFMSGYTPISSHNKIASAKINCVQTEICPSGERHDIDVGETLHFNNGFGVRVNSVIPGYPDAYANITVTEVNIVPNINISSILLSETSVTIGDEVVFEVCMTNNGDRGDIELYTGFAYQDFIGGPALFLNGYLEQTIGDVLSGEYLCPYGEISVTQEVIDAKKSGKDVKFWALAVPGNKLSKTIIIEIEDEPTGTVSLDKTSYEQGELITATWSNANFTGGIFSIINPSGSVKKQLPVNASVGMVYYELPNDASLGSWSAVLDYESVEVDSKNFNVTEGCIPNWRCRQPLDGYEIDINNCGEADRYNSECEPQELVDITVEVSDGINYIENATVKIILTDNPQEEKTCTTSSDGECIISDLIANTSYEVNVIKMGYICTSGCGIFNSGNGGTIEVVMRETGCLKSFLPSKSLFILNEDEELILSGSVVNIDSENEQNIGIVFVRPDSIEIDKDIGLLNKCEDKSYNYNFGKVESEVIGKWFLKQCEIINEVWNVTEIASVHVVRPIKSQPPIEPSKKGTLLILSAAGLGTYLLTKKK